METKVFDIILSVKAIGEETYPGEIERDVEWAYQHLHNNFQINQTYVEVFATLVKKNDPIEAQINRCKEIAKDIHRSIDPKFDCGKFLASMKIHKVVAESRLQMKKVVFEQASKMDIDSSNKYVLDEMSVEIAEYVKEIEVLSYVIDSIESGKYLE